MSSAFIQRGLKPVITHASSRTEAWEVGGGPCGALAASPDTRAPVSAPALRTSMCNRCVKYGLGKSTQNHTHNYTKTANRHTGLAAIVISTVRILLHCLAVCPPLLYLLLDLCAFRQLWISPKNRRAGRYALGFVPVEQGAEPEEVVAHRETCAG